MAKELTEELKVLITAEVSRAVRNLQNVDRQIKQKNFSRVLEKPLLEPSLQKQSWIFSRNQLQHMKNTLRF